MRHASSLGVALVLLIVGCGTGGSPAVDGGATGDSPASALSIRSLSPNLQISGGTAALTGTRICDPALTVGAAATGTTIELTMGAVTVPVSSVTRAPDFSFGGVDHQVLQLVIPPRTGTPWGPREVVSLRVTYAGSSATTPFEYDDPP